MMTTINLINNYPQKCLKTHRILQLKTLKKSKITSNQATNHLRRNMMTITKPKNPISKYLWSKQQPLPCTKPPTHSSTRQNQFQLSQSNNQRNWKVNYQLKKSNMSQLSYWPILNLTKWMMKIDKCTYNSSKGKSLPCRTEITIRSMRSSCFFIRVNSSRRSYKLGSLKTGNSSSGS